MTAATIIYAVQHNILAKYTDSACDIKHTLKTGGSIDLGPALTLTNADTELRRLMTYNLITALPWTIADLNALEVGQDYIG